MADETRYFLAQYTIRSKQAYIFRTNAMREMTGASTLIRNAWETLFQAAAEVGVCAKRAAVPFEWKSAFADGVGMVELFCGGGNETVLYRNKAAFRLVNAAFTRRLLTDAPGMVPLCVGVDVACENYIKDYERLMRTVESEKKRMAFAAPQSMLPFSLMDRRTFQPITERRIYADKQEEELSAEAAAKREAYDASYHSPDGKLLDELASDGDGRGLLAVVHADGNNMGKKIMAYLGDASRMDYNKAVTLMRTFTSETQKAFIDGPMQALDSDPRTVRCVIADGDDVTFVCNAKDALALTETYLKQVEAYEFRDREGKRIRFSSCAGICIFHAHYPFFMAYRLAEDACDAAKVRVHRTGKDESWIDFHYIHSGLAQSLDEIRAEQGTGPCMARPWRIGASEDSAVWTAEKMRQTAKLLQAQRVSRSRIKRIGAVMENDLKSTFPRTQKELVLLYDRHPGVKEQLEQMAETETDLLRGLYDLYETYDLWFRADGKEEA